MSDLISRLADADESDLDDLARLTNHHYQKLIDRGLPAELAAQLARDLHTAWLAAIYSDAILMRDRSLAAIAGNDSALEDRVLTFG